MANRDLTPAELNQLEMLVDATSVNAVLQALSEVCGLKAEHIESNWQDTVLAHHWRVAEGAIGCAATSREVLKIS